MLTILLGEDDYSLQEALDAIKKDIGDQGVFGPGTTELNGPQVTVEQLKSVCETVPFLAQKRLVVVRGLLARFEPKAKAGRGTPAPSRQPAEHQTFAEYMTKLPPTTVLVLVDGRVKGGNPLLKALSGHVEVKTFPFLKEAALWQWVPERVKVEGGTISTEAVGLLARLVGSDLWSQRREIEKLVAYAAGRRIEEEDVRRVTSHVQQANVFALIDAVLEARGVVAAQLLHRLLRSGAPAPFIFAMLFRQVELIVRAGELDREGRPRAEIQGKLGLASEYALRKTLEQAQRYPMRQIRDVYQRLLDSDLAVKTGRYDGELALTILVTELCQRPAPAARAGSRVAR